LSNKAILLSNLKKGAMELALSEVEAKEIFENAMRNVPQSLLHKNIKVEMKDDESIVMDVDEKLVTTSLTYLLDNAHRFSPKESKITVFALKDPDGKVRINVMDSGPGIPESRLNTLFDAFGVQDVAHHGRGHGLSLAIVKHIMTLHHGKVAVENNSNGPGCIISLIFPEESLKNS
jgi:K+-sensing histidine kinase KdpD